METEQVNTVPEQPRNEAGHFEGRDADLRSQLSEETVKTAMLAKSALDAGLIEPSDEMAPGVWKAAFEGRMQQSHASRDIARDLKAESTPEADPENDVARKVLESYNDKLTSFRGQCPDFDEKVGSLHLNQDVGSAVQIALLEDERGPELAYHIASHPEIAERLNSLSPTAAVKAIGRLAAEVSSRDDYYNQVTAEHLNTPTSRASQAAAEQAYLRKAEEMYKGELSQEDRQLANNMPVAAHVYHTIVALDAPEIARHLLDNPRELARLNHLPALAAAGELSRLKVELVSEGRTSNSWAPPATRRPVPAPISPTRHTGSGNSSLSDNMSTDVWARGFRRKMGWDK